MRVEVLYFASLKEVLRCAGEEVELARSTPRLSDLIELLLEKYPSLRLRLPALRFAVNEQFSELETPLRAGDVVALIPPVSGG